MPTTPNMNLVLPTEGGDANIWDTILATVFSLIDAHDHSTGKGVPVTAAGITIGADLSFGGLWASTNMRAVDFTPVAPATVSALAGAFFVNSSDSNNLYFRTVAGSNVKVTDGASLNVAGFVGGIGGDYSTAGALVDYVAATDLYRFRGPDPGSGRPWESIASGRIDIYEQATTVANRVRLQSPAALAASYALTLPAALPGAQSMLQTSSAGVITASNTVPTAVTVTTGGVILSASYVHLSATQQNAFFPQPAAGSWSQSIDANKFAVITITATNSVAVPISCGLDNNTIISAVALQGYSLASQPVITFNNNGANVTYTQVGTFGTSATNVVMTFDTPQLIGTGIITMHVNVVLAATDFNMVRGSLAWTRP